MESSAFGTTVVPSTSHLDRHGYLFGYPIAHSMSPILHQTIYDGLGLNWSYLLLESLDTQLFLKLTKDPKFYGAAVTMPHKVAICQYLDDLTEEGRAVGACNTVFLRQEGEKRLLIGTNTDTIGIREAFYQNLPNAAELIDGRPGMVVGGGGAARAAVYCLKRFMKCETVYLVNREKAEVDAVLSWCKAHGYGEGLIHVSTAAQAEGLEGPGAIVSCVPDIPPSTEVEWEARRTLETLLAKPHKGAILEMAYHPAPHTTIAAIATKNKWTVILGTEAMIWQGIEQDKYWTGRDASEMPVEEVKRVIAGELSKATDHVLA